MNATPDPQTVREIARTAVGYVIRDHLVQAAMAEHGISADNVYAWSEVYDAVLDTIAAGAQEPDSQQPAAPVSGEQQDGALAAVRRFAHAWDYGNDVVDEDRYAPVSTLSIGEHAGGTARMTPPQLLAVLAERDALASRVTELTAEREHDLREVQSLLFGNYGPLRAGIESLFDRRIAELEA